MFEDLTQDSDARVLQFDFPSVAIGIGEYPDGPTGCTVFKFAKRCDVAIDVRGGSPGYIGTVRYVDAICFAGGSIYGLEAAAGVQREMWEERDRSVEWGSIAIVDAAIIYDWGGRGNRVYPDMALGRHATRIASTGTFPLGRRGAGMNATVGKGIPGLNKEYAGQGGAFRQIGSVKVAAFTVVNAVGTIVDRQGRVVRGCLDPATGDRVTYAAGIERSLVDQPVPAPPGNTTITLVVTDQILSEWELRQMGRQVHASMARAIQPFHALSDGDVLFAVSTGEVAAGRVNVTALATLASELAWDAVLSAIPPE